MPKIQIRFRHVFIYLGGLLTIMSWVLTDPEIGVVQALPIGASTVATLLILLKSTLYVGMLHLSRKALFDYINLGEYFDIAKREPVAAGLALCSISIASVAIAIVMYAATSS